MGMGNGNGYANGNGDGNGDGRASGRELATNNTRKMLFRFDFAFLSLAIHEFSFHFRLLLTFCVLLLGFPFLILYFPGIGGMSFGMCVRISLSQQNSFGFPACTWPQWR